MQSLAAALAPFSSGLTQFGADGPPTRGDRSKHLEFTATLADRWVRIALVALAFGCSSLAVGAPTPLGNVIAIAAGMEHQCAVTVAGSAKCWGRNEFGEVGDGSTLDRAYAVDVVGLNSGVVRITAGAYHTCALTSAGGVKCWGRNDYGELGNGTVSRSPVPVNVIGLESGVAAVVAGGSHTCALTNGGAVKCWGWNQQGQLGDGTTTNRSTPVHVIGLSGEIAAIAPGGSTCALTVTGGIKCWGDNSWGQLGDGTQLSRTIPVDVSGLGGPAAALGQGPTRGHNCALAADGSVKCWGRNTGGQLGFQYPQEQLTPITLSVVSTSVSKIAAAYSHTCALTSAGGVECWGANDTGQLGDGTTNGRPFSSPVSGLASGVTDVAAGGGQNCALTTGGGVKCWGGVFMKTGMLGDGSQGDRLTPVDVVQGYVLSVTKSGRGDGTITSVPNEINCGVTCRFEFLSGTTVTLSAVPDAHSTFTGWTGACAGLGPCTVTMDAAKNVGATFGAPVALFWSAGDNCAGGSAISLNATTTSARISLCTTSPTRGICGATIQPQSAGHQSGRLRIDDRVLGVPLPDATQGSIAFPVPISNPASSIDFGGTISPVAGVLTAPPALPSDQVLATFQISAGANAGNGSYTVGLSANSSVTTAVPGNDCLTQSSDTPITPSFTVNLVRLNFLQGLSRKSHGGSSRDLSLSGNATTPTIEPRFGPSHQIVFVFDNPVIGGSVALTEGAATIGTPTFVGNEMTVPLSSVANGQYVTVAVTNVAAAGGSATASGAVRFAFLAGDVNASRSVTATDILLEKGRSGQNVDAGNFLFDLNANGSITAIDVLAVKSVSGTSLPPP